MNYEQLSNERKVGQAYGLVPTWMATGGYQLFMSNYLYDAKNPREQFKRIAATAAKHAAGFLGLTQVEWKNKFFHHLWEGNICCSTPVLANMGTNRASPVSCSGSDCDDSIYGIFEKKAEIAVLSKEGFGTSINLSNIRPRGSAISTGGKADGVIKVIEGLINDTDYVKQGTSRRGAVAFWLDIEHGDFWEVAEHVKKHPDGFNLGWVVKDSFLAKLEAGDEEANKRWKRAVLLRMVPGRGYFLFVDKANRRLPETYVKNNLNVKMSNLCTEILLHNDTKENTFTCVLSWLNLSRWNEWKDTDAAFVATVFLDCVVSEFLLRAQNIKGLEKAVNFTRKGRAIGLGVGGFHTYLQQNKIAWGSLECRWWNQEVFKHINEQSLAASKQLAKHFGEPEWCKGTGLRFTHRMAVAPTKSTGLIYGGISEGINPVQACVFTQQTAAGEVHRVIPPLLDIIKRKGLDLKKCTQDVVNGFGSVQRVDWLTDEEKLYLRIGAEVSMDAHIEMTSRRQEYIDQGQSFNLYYAKGVKQSEVARHHRKIALDPNMISAYYAYSSRDVISTSQPECVACQ